MVGFQVLVLQIRMTIKKKELLAKCKNSILLHNTYWQSGGVILQPKVCR